MNTNGSTPDRRPVLYLDIDDTLVQYRDGQPSSAPGAREFMEYALERFEVRWLTTWCPNGRMGDDLLGDLCEMLEFDRDVLGKIRGFDWEHSESKADGIAWLEHLILGRPFVWIEDDYGVGPFELRILSEYGFSDSFRSCNVTEDPESLQRLHRSLLSELEDSERREAREGGEASEASEVSGSPGAGPPEGSGGGAGGASSPEGSDGAGADQAASYGRTATQEPDLSPL